MMHKSRCGTGSWSLIGGVMAVAALLCSPIASADPAAAKLSPAEVQAISEEGFVYGLPLVMNYSVMNAFSVNRDSGQFKAPFNQIHCEANVFTHENTAVVTPNSDTPYCLLWLDLRAEPMVVSVPRFRNRVTTRYTCATAIPLITVSSGRERQVRTPAIT